MSYHRGHVTGTRRQHHTASRWYDAIEAATLARLDATWPESNDTVQEVTHDLPDVTRNAQSDTATTLNTARQ